MRTTYFLFMGLSVLLPLSSGVSAGEGQLLNLRKLTRDGNSIAPVFSPADKNLLAFTAKKYQGISLLHLDRKQSLSTGENVLVAEKLNGAEQAGFGFSWTSGGDNIVFRSRGEKKQQAAILNIENKKTTNLSDEAEQVSVPVVSEKSIFFAKDAKSMRVRLKDPRKRLFSAASTPASQVLPEQQGDEIYLNKQAVSPEGSVCWLPRLSPDDLKLGFECWEGIYVYDIKAKQRYFLDQGSSPAWSKDSTKLVYEQTTDDGYRITTSDVFIIDYDGKNKIRLSSGSDLIVRRPSLSPDGKQIAVDIGGDVYLADVEIKE